MIEHASKRHAVQFHQSGGKLLKPRLRGGIGALLGFAQQIIELLHPRLHLTGVGHAHSPVMSYACAPNIGTWRTSSFFPPPTYMCTPHGRHGSKLLTARMMSMPLKLSGPFSSKIGVFCTASS